MFSNLGKKNSWWGKIRKKSKKIRKSTRDQTLINEVLKIK